MVYKHQPLTTKHGLNQHQPLSVDAAHLSISLSPEKPGTHGAQKVREASIPRAGKPGFVEARLVFCGTNREVPGAELRAGSLDESSLGVWGAELE